MKSHRFKSCHWLRAVAHIALTLLVLASTVSVRADENIIDCPLRDAPLSVDTPMMDIMASPAARTVLEQTVPALMSSIPPMFTGTEAPSLSAIMTLRGATALLRMPMDDDTLGRLDSQLAAVDVSEDEKAARCARYDNDVPDLALSAEDVQILVFDKFNGYGHGEGTAAATEAIKAIAQHNGWGVTVTNRGGVFTPDILRRFALVVWNNVSGDVLTLSQRRAFEDYINQGGAFLGIHGSGGDFIYLWDWYVNELIGAQFVGHTMDPHYQDAQIDVEETSSGIGNGLELHWIMYDEWYSFAGNPRARGASVVARVDESTYTPEMSGLSLRMGEDHPIAWSRCVGQGRAFYTAIGHLPDVYKVPQNIALLERALSWAAGSGSSGCGAS